MMLTRAVPAVILLLLAACANAGSTGGDGSRPAGRTFLSTAVTGHTLVEGTQIQLEFPEEGKLNARAGCNHLFGEVTYAGDRMKVSGMGGTDMGCEKARMDQDQWLTEFLKAGPKFTLTGDELVLTGDQVTIKLLDRKAAQPDKSLSGTRWVLESLIDGQSVSSVPPGVEAFLQFQDDKVLGNGGCNGLGGQAVQGPGTVTFSSVFATKKACGPPRDQVESVVLAVLDGKVAAKIDGDVLELKHPNGKGLQLRSAGEPRPTSS
ncbi:MAG TPA: META domain-containing protein [Candidatus Limnocylindrales bacterium]|nr:META domain-containing protein [Candidatus Limnocylindrales bacterium]